MNQKEIIVIDSDSSDTVSVDNSTDEEKTPPKVMTANSESGKKCKALEIFCGCAGRTLTLSNEGFDATGVDYAGNKDKTEGRTVLIDASHYSLGAEGNH